MSNTDGSEMLSVLIIGCGNIAGGLDAAGGDTVLTHAGAYRQHGGFRLVACVEPDADRRAAFQKRWSTERSYAELSDALGTGIRYDVISICSPTAHHATDLREILTAGPRLVFCEKPMTSGVTEAGDLVVDYRNAGILLAVNHTRRWDPEIAAFKMALQDGKWGSVRSVVGYYNKGIINNGSHMVDMLQYLLGPLEVRAVGSVQNDYSTDDPVVPALLATVDGIPVHLVTGAASDYALFEVQFVMERGVIAIEEGGFKWRERAVQDSPYFASYRIIGSGTQRPGRYGDAMLRAASNIHDAVTKSIGLASSGETALSAHTLCNDIRRRAVAAERR